MFFSRYPSVALARNKGRERALQARFAKKLSLFGHICFNIEYDRRLLRQKAGGACLYNVSAPGWILASHFWSYTPSQSWLFRGQKISNN